MKRAVTISLLLLLPALFISCAGSLRPYQTQPPRVHFQTQTGQYLKELPDPKQKIVAAVYGFRDQTGQYKPSKSISYSTAVTQGATSILIEAMEKSGWFIPIERAGIANLLNERRIIRSTRQQNNDANKLKPLLFAGILLEGGIIGYDANVVTSGAGVRFLGSGASGQFRKDKVTIYLRAVSTQTGRILKSVRTTKSIVSQKLQGGIFRYVDTNRLLESEIGITYNEPSVTAVTAAINAAIRKLIIEGVKENIWAPANASAFSKYKTNHQFATALSDTQAYIDYYGMTHRPSLRSGWALTTNFTYGSHIGNYPDEIQSTGLLIQLEGFLNHTFSVKASYQRSVVGAKNIFERPANNFDLLINAYLTPDFKLSPYVSAGGGVVMIGDLPPSKSGIHPAFTAEAGLDYQINDWLGFRIGVNYRYLLSGDIDGISAGSISDQQWNIITGITIF